MSGVDGSSASSATTGGKSVILKRYETSNQGTFGRLINIPFILYTGELPWNSNEPNISCIPEGKYNARWTYSPHFLRKMYLLDVPQRVGVRMHSANFMGVPSPPWLKQLEGCIALGEKLGIMGNQKAVLLSRPALRRFEDLMAGKPFILEVQSCL